jgi:hypothetical protein
LKDQLVKEAIFQSQEEIITGIRPGELDVLLCKVNQRMGEVAIM